MRNFKNFRPLNETEFRIVHATLDRISSNITLFIKNKRLALFISVPEQDKKYLVYLISEKLRKLILSFQNDVSMTSAGLYLGFLSRNNFFLSLEGAEVFLKEKLIPDQNILNVTNKGEKGILYGNPIIKRRVFNIPSDLQKNSILLVLNKSRKLIALARSEIDYTNFKLLNQEDLVAINLIDKGYYLRRKQ
ncbi:MAG: NIP7 pre-PUA domain-containing protein [Promethearchaeota archaeon]